MNLQIVDGAQWSLSSKMFKRIARNQNRRGLLAIPGFANISTHEYGIDSNDLSSILRQNVSSLVGLLGGAEDDGFQKVIIGGSPISYYVFSQIKGRTLSEKVELEFERVMSALNGMAQVYIVNPPEGVKLGKHDRVINTSEVQLIHHMLLGKYKDTFGEENVHVVSI